MNSNPATASPPLASPAAADSDWGMQWAAKSRMRAMVYDDYGDADMLHEAQLEVPRRLPGQILIAVAAAGINPIDARLRRGELKWVLPGGFPRVPGFDVAGVVAATGDDGRFRVGDRVMAFLDHRRGGGYAELATCAADAAVQIPATLAFETAAAMPLAGTTALQALRDHGKLQPGDRVLINGASGGVGMFAVQIAKAYRAEVAAVASGANEAFCRSLGADQFFNYETTDFTDLGERWDLIFDAAGKASYLAARRVLAPGGRYVTTEPDARGILATLLSWPLGKTGSVIMAHPRSADLAELIRLSEAGQVRVTIDRSYPLQRAAEAQRRIETGVDHGKLVLTVTPGATAAAEADGPHESRQRGANQKTDDRADQ